MNPAMLYITIALALCCVVMIVLAITRRQMRRATMYVAILAALGGVLMMIAGISGREMNTTLAGYGALLAFVSLLGAFITRVMIGQRGA